ncbi:MAG: rRNA maturation RNase YbeY [Holosporales bacterium]|jgi:probable rRNA maturation factor|nr:rRNA maturation RNase YbeY [Holosporales bacterium]
MGYLRPNRRHTVSISFANNQWVEVMAKASVWRQLAKRCILATFEEVAWESPSNVSMVFADDATVMQLNSQYRGKNEPTNVLSFPQLTFSAPTIPVAPAKAAQEISQIVICIGDIVLSLETVLKESVRDGLPFSDHVSHLIVHGALHLLGFDHVAVQDAEVMEKVEVSVLAKLGIRDPFDRPSNCDFD